MSDADREIRALVALGRGDLPKPGRGATLSRWQALARVASQDLALAKLYEGHTDALAIIAELDGLDVLDVLGGPGQGAGELWGVWAAEPPDGRLGLRRERGRVLLSGRKAWCSGAGVVTHALVTAWDAHGRQCLLAVPMTAAGITVTDQGWHAVGMGTVSSPDVLFDDVEATMVGVAGSYTERPGFWHGGCGIAACWYGGTTPLARALAEKARGGDDPHLHAHLGVVDVALRSLRALLIEAACWIDEHPRDSARTLALRVRAAADETASLVHRHAGRGLGAGPLCRDPAVARRFADLPVFIRQTHAERDLAELGRSVAAAGDDWRL